MDFTYQEIVDRAKVWVDDDHAETKGWIKDDKWLAVAFAEHRKLYRQMIRSGIQTIPWISETFTISAPASPLAPGTYQFVKEEPVAIIGVAELVGNASGYYYRPLTAANSAFGGAGLWQGTQTSGKPTYWYLGADTSPNVDDSPYIWFDKPDIGGTYEVRYVPAITKPTLLADTLKPKLLLDTDELLVCRLAKAAHTKDSTISGALEARLKLEEAEFAFKTFGATGESPRVRRVRPKERHTLSPYSSNPMEWIYR